jgi:hypothetical protein
MADKGFDGGDFHGVESVFDGWMKRRQGADPSMSCVSGRGLNIPKRFDMVPIKFYI